MISDKTTNNKYITSFMKSSWQLKLRLFKPVLCNKPGCRGVATQLTVNESLWFAKLTFDDLLLGDRKEIETKYYDHILLKPLALIKFYILAKIVAVDV